MDSYYPQTLLNSLLAPIKKHLGCFEVVSGEQLGQVLSVEVVNSSMHSELEFFNIGRIKSSLLRDDSLENEEDAYQELQRTPDDVAENIHLDKLEGESPTKGIEPQSLTSQAKRSKEITEDTSDKEKQSGKDISFESLSEHFGRPLDDEAKSFGVSRSTFKHICRALGIERWQNGKRRMNNNSSSKLRRRLNDVDRSRRNISCSGRPPVSDTVVAHRSQDLNKITVKATYKRAAIRFELSGLSGIAELEDHVIERLQLQRKSFSIKYQDDEGDWVLIACDKDVWECIEISRSLSQTTIKMLLDQPINHYES